MGIRTAIVVEGGAMRGIFSAGVLDGLQQLGLDEFDLAIGTSAGACNLASFLARQHERNLRCYTNIMARPRLFSLKRALSGGHYMDLDWLWDTFASEEPLDQPAIAARRTEFVAVATCARTAEPVYMSIKAPNVHDHLKAGCALPLLYRGPVHVEQHALVDGGMVDPIPAREAYRRGARRILVIRSRPSAVVKRDGPLDGAVAALLRGQPALAAASRLTARRYREAVEFVRQPPPDAQLLELAPERPLATGRTTQERKALTSDYRLGLLMAEQYATRVKELLQLAAPRALATL